MSSSRGNRARHPIAPASRLRRGCSKPRRRVLILKARNRRHESEGTTRQDSEGVMFLSPFVNRMHLAIWIALLVLVVIPAAVALRVWLRD
jgi:hypothetical protein